MLKNAPKIHLTILAAGCVIFLMVPTIEAVETTVPDFGKSRPKGRRRLLDPLPKQQPAVPKIRFGVFRPFNAIDAFILTKIQARKKKENILPGKLCNDWDFARRSSLDLVGVIPLVKDLKTYFDWKKKERRGKWIDLLLKQKQYADHWSTYWGNLFRERGRIRGAPANALKSYLHQCLKENRPFDQWVRELITAEGSAEDNPAVAFVLQDRADGKVLTVSISEAFLGVQLKCAQCHDHPFQWWTQDDFRGMAAFWSGTRMQLVRMDQRKLKNGRTIPIPIMGIQSSARWGKGQFLDGVTSDLGRGREALADLITRRENPYFARVAVNRLWEKMMGRGLVDPPSDFSATNPPSHPQLLDWLAIELINSGYDLKHILRLIANSRTYQQTSRPAIRRRTANHRRRQKSDPKQSKGVLYESMIVRRMTAEQIYDSILAATGLYDNSLGFRSSYRMTYPPPPQSFLSVFGASDRKTIMPHLPSDSIQQKLTMLNGNFLSAAIGLHQGHPIRYWSDIKRYNTNQIIDALFAQILTRPPTPHERLWAQRCIASEKPAKAWEDIQWALFNTREFQYIR